MSYINQFSFDTFMAITGYFNWNSGTEQYFFIYIQKKRKKEKAKLHKTKLHHTLPAGSSHTNPLATRHSKHAKQWCNKILISFKPTLIIRWWRWSWCTGGRDREAHLWLRWKVLGGGCCLRWSTCGSVFSCWGEVVE